MPEIPPTKESQPKTDVETPDADAAPMTDSQREELMALKKEAGEAFDPNMSQAEADQEILRLRS